MNKFDFKQGAYGDYITFNGKELSRDEILKILNKNQQLRIGGDSSSDLIEKAEQMQKENEVMINGAKGHDYLVYYKGLGLGIDRIVNLIKSHYS